MTNQLNQPNDQHELSRLEELLADRAVFGLEINEQSELERLLVEAQGASDEYDLIAAGVWLCNHDNQEVLPDGVRAQLLQQAPADVVSVSERKNHSSPGWGSLFFATAASLLLGLYLGSINPSAPAVEIELIALLEEQSDVVRVAWTPTDDPAAVGFATEQRDAADWGEVVWSDSLQKGYMRFRGLAANDPSVEQYQLWVFDSARSDEHPVDGGVFDLAAVKATGDYRGQIVEIQAKLPVSEAVMFAITVEKPGGVVVSDRSRLPLLAKL